MYMQDSVVIVLYTCKHANHAQSLHILGTYGALLLFAPSH